MTDFHQAFEEFQEKYSIERGKIISINAINLKSQTDLKDHYNNYIISQYLLNRLNYSSATMTDQTIEDMKFLLKDITPISVANTLKLFQKSNHKDRFAYLIFLLLGNPQMLAQIVYLYLIFDVIPKDDKQFFIFVTFPAMYQSFVCTTEQKLAITLIKNMFLLHTSIHGSQYSIKFKFLSDMCFSYFLSSNPGHFFGVVLKPIICEFRENIASDQYEYSVVNGRLLRASYYAKCLTFAIKLMERMIKCINLLPDSAITFLNQLTGDTISNILLFESTICNYLENPNLCDDHLPMKDICSVIRCSYPQNLFPSNLYPDIQNPELLKQVSIDIFFDAIKQNDSRRGEDNLSASVKLCDRYFVVSPRDLHIIQSMVSLFMHHVKDDDVKQLAEHFSTLADVTQPSEQNQVLLLKVWGGDRSDIFSYKPTKNFDDIIDGLAMLDKKQLKYNSATELTEVALMYCGKFLNLSQRFRIQSTGQFFTKENLDSAYSTVQSNVSGLKDLSDNCFSSIYFLSTEKKKTDEQIIRLSKILVLRRFLPILQNMYYESFNFAVRDVFEVRAIIPRIFSAIDKHIAPMKLSQRITKLISMTLFGSYFNSVDKILGFQEKAVKNVDAAMTKYIMDNSNIELSDTHRSLVDRAIRLFTQISLSMEITEIIELVLGATTLLKNLPNNVVSYAVAKSLNTAVIGFHNFFRSYMLDNKRVMEVMFDSEEQKLMQKFHSGALNIRH